MASAPDGGEDLDISSNSNRSSDIVHIDAARDEPWLLSGHAIPDRPGLFVAGVAGAQEIAFELTP
jgi:hypothetical protein